MLILIFINIIVIVYIYLKYYKFPKDENNTKAKIVEIEKMNPIIMGCINDRGFNNNFDLILAEIIDLNVKGYIKIEYDREDINAYDYTIKQNFDMEVDDIKKYELILLKFLFSEKMEISKSELEEKLINTFNSYNVQYNDLQQVLEEELVKQNIIDECKNKELKKLAKIYKRISIVSIIVVLTLKTFIFTKISLLSILIYILEKIISNLLILNASNYTDKGEILRKDIITYKIEIEKQKFLEDKETMNQIVLDKSFADSIALHISTQAKKIFVDNKMLQNATKNSKKITVKTVIVFIVILLIGLILQKVTKSITKDGIIWLYMMLAIIIAFSADVTKIIGTSKKKKY